MEPSKAVIDGLAGADGALVASTDASEGGAPQLAIGTLPSGKGAEYFSSQ